MSIEQKIANFQHRIAERLVIVNEQLATEAVPVESAESQK
jgi:hypothetical protein